jgi:N-acetylneuraminate synthase
MHIYVVAEIGINHNGSVETAVELMRVAKASGADAVKFQKRTVELVYTPEELAAPRESVFGRTNGDLKRGLEFGVAEYDHIFTESKRLGLDWSASCWDVPSVHFLATYQPKWLKVPSALLTDHALLTQYRRTDIPIWLSTGMSTEQEVRAACAVVSPAVLFHCHSAYPSPIEELNLSYLRTLPDVCETAQLGYSSHTVSPWPCLMAVCLGARVVEAHLTLDRTMWGSDQAASLEPAAFAKLVTEIRTFERAYGDGVKRVWDSELPAKKKLRKA